MRRSLVVALALLAPLLALRLPAQQSRPFDFTIQNIMRGPELYGREPQQVSWTPDGRWLYFSWLEPGAKWNEELKPYRVRATAGAKPERLTPAQMDSAGPLVAEGSTSRDRRWRAVSYDGDIYLVDLRRSVARRLTETTAAESAPTISADGRRLYFSRDNNAFEIDLASGLVRQLTDVRTGPPPDSAKKPEGQRGFLAEQQRELLGAVRDKVEKDSLAKAERERRDSLRPKPLYLKKDERIATLRIAPSGRALLFVTTATPEKAERTKVPNYVTESGYTEELTVRTKVGDVQPAGRVGYVTLPRGEVRWLDVVPGDSTRPPAFVEITGWNDAGDAALLFAVSRDYKTRYLQRVDSAGAVAVLDSLRDTAWVSGPCFGCAGWSRDGRRVWYVSERDGYAHLYSLAADGSDRRQLTSGKWEVLDVELSPDGRTFYLHTSEVSPFERQLYRMPVGGGARTRLTAAPGGHTAVVSPDGRALADVHSYANRPPELYLGPATAGAKPAQLTVSTTDEWRSHDWLAPEIVTIPASDGVKVPARIYRPVGQSNGAGVIFVHGAGYLHNVHNWWSTYAREYMFNQFLASKGYTVLDIDYRGSAGYGRDWRTAIYRHMGGRDLQDQVDGSRYLQKELGIDPERVGIYGGSYGGFITLMALFTEPKHFGAGAALRSVTDWAHYNHPYTSQILNQPQDDSAAYRQSSPIYFAEGLEDPLLIAHGMVDVNVHFQDVVRLNERLIELGKTGWEMAVYPVEDHAFVRPSSWADEYRRIFELFERHLPVRAATTSVGSSK
jgi:dipeptidyl aminopeptidase/acylaminoacyl peptidase